MLSHDDLKAILESGDKKLMRKAISADFRSFVRLFWPMVATSELREGYYFDALCDHLQNLRDIKKLVINLPPRHGKSTLCAVLFPAWLWTNAPSLKVLSCSYSLQLSTRDSMYCRNVVESPLYQRCWPRVKLAQAQHTKTRFENINKGFRLATSVDSSVLGEGADLIIADDPNNVNEMSSQAYRQSVLDFWTQTLSTRSNPLGLGCWLVIQQRCHEQDVTGYILANDTANAWTRLILPWDGDQGQPLSDLYSAQQIQELRGGNGLGPRGFACQFNQHPVAEGGNVFQRDWFQSYTQDDECFYLGDEKIRKEWVKVFCTSDLAISLRNEADWTCCLTFGMTPHGHLILLDEYRQKVEGPQMVKAFKGICERWKPQEFWIEDVAFQRLMIQLLRQENLPIKAIRPDTDKKARSQRAQIKAECGMVWVPKKPWVEDWLDEICAFPGGGWDDRVDCLSYGAIVAHKYGVRELPVELTEEDKALEEQRRWNAAALAGLD